MIEFRDSAQRQGKAILERAGWSSSSTGYFLNATFELPAACSKSSVTVGGETVWRRSPLDFIRTGAVSRQGNKPCDHRTVSGFVELQPLDETLILSNPSPVTTYDVIDELDPRAIFSYAPNAEPYWSGMASNDLIIPKSEANWAGESLGYEKIFALDYGGISFVAHPRAQNQCAGSGTNTWVLFSMGSTDTTQDIWPTLYWSRVIGYRSDGAVVVESGNYSYSVYSQRGTAIISVTAKSKSNTGMVARSWTPSRGWTRSSGTTYSVTTHGQNEALAVIRSRGGSLSRVSSFPDTVWLSVNTCQDADCNAQLVAGQQSHWSDGRIDDAMNVICAQCLRILSHDGSPTYDIRELHDNIMDKIPYFNGNMLAYVRDVRDILGTAVAVARFISSPSVSTLSSAWLSTRYGTRLTVQDTEEIVSGFERAALDHIKSTAARIGKTRSFGWEKLRERNTTEWTVETDGSLIDCHRIYNSTVQFRRDDLGGVLNMTRNLIEWDAIPDAQNIWDLIPYSFVVDWIVDVESVMSGIDRRLESAYYQILSVVDSIKTVFHMSDLPLRSTSSNLLVSLDFRDYHRWVSKDLSFTPFRISEGHLASKNVLDGAALLVGRN